MGWQRNSINLDIGGKGTYRKGGSRFGGGLTCLMDSPGQGSYIGKASILFLSRLSRSSTARSWVNMTRSISSRIMACFHSSMRQAPCVGGILLMMRGLRGSSGLRMDPRYPRRLSPKTCLRREGIPCFISRWRACPPSPIQRIAMSSEYQWRGILMRIRTLDRNCLAGLI